MRTTVWKSPTIKGRVGVPESTDFGVIMRKEIQLKGMILSNNFFISIHLYFDFTTNTFIYPIS